MRSRRREAARRIGGTQPVGTDMNSRPNILAADCLPNTMSTSVAGSLRSPCGSRPWLAGSVCCHKVPRPTVRPSSTSSRTSFAS
jgi:hypothetical protein